MIPPIIPPLAMLLVSNVSEFFGEQSLKKGLGDVAQIIGVSDR
jgi:hypothetical protein